MFFHYYAGNYVLAKCSEVKQPETTYPKETRSNSGDKSGLTNPDDEPLTPDENDIKPTTTLTVDDEDTFIESDIIAGAANVGSVTVAVVDEDGNEVCFPSNYHSFCN